MNAMTIFLSAEDRTQHEHLASLPGSPGSGMARYAAAMYFHKRGFISIHALEVYRTLAKDDKRDPVAILNNASCDKDVAFVLKKGSAP